MKQLRIFLLFFCSIILLASCSDLNKEEENVLPNLSSLGLTRAHEEIAANQMDFGVAFFRSIARQSDMRNVLVSPFSMSLDLSMLAEGASGKTYSELARGLGFEGFTSEQISEYYSAIIKANRANENTQVETANALWLNKNKLASASVNKSYVNEVKEKYDAQIEQIDFSEGQMFKIINQWGEDHTNGRIKNLLTSNPSEDVVAILTNALYFEGTWLWGRYEKTKKDFRGIDETVNNHDFIFGTNSYQSEYNTTWSKSKDPAALTLGYGDGYKIMIIVPPAGKSLDKFVNDITAQNIRTWANKSTIPDEKIKMTFYLPTFHIESSNSVKFCKQALQDMGINSIFGPFADLDKICPDVYVNSVFQQTFIDLNEYGTTAAAVSYLDISGPSYVTPLYEKEYDFVVDRPFVYVIMDRYQSILFMGTVTDLK